MNPIDDSMDPEIAIEIPNVPKDCKLLRKDSILYSTAADDARQFVNSGTGPIETAATCFLETYEGLPDLLRIVLAWGQSYFKENLLHLAIEEAIVENYSTTLIPDLDKVLSKPGGGLPALSRIINSERWKNLIMDLLSKAPRCSVHNAIERESRLAAAKIPRDALRSKEAILTQITTIIKPFLRDYAFQSLPPPPSDPREPTHFDSSYKLAPPPTPEQAAVNHLLYRVSVLCAFNETSLKLSQRLFADLSRQSKDAKSRSFYRRIAEHTRAEAVDAEVATGKPRLSALADTLRIAVYAQYEAVNLEPYTPLVNAINALALQESSESIPNSAANSVISIYSRLLGPIRLEEIHGPPLSQFPPDPNLACFIDVDSIEAAEEIAILTRLPCIAEVFDESIRALFVHSRRPAKSDCTANRRLALSFLVAYGHEFRKHDEESLRMELQDDKRREAAAKRVVDTVKLLGVIVPTCENLPAGTAKFHVSAAVNTLRSGMSNLSVARGILMWAREGLRGGEELDELRVTAPLHLGIVSCVAESQPELRLAALDVLRNVFADEYKGQNQLVMLEVRERVVECITAFAKVDLAPAVVRLVREHWADDNSVDPSHLRICLIGMLRVLAPPYDAQFAKTMRKTLMYGRIASSMKLCNLAEKRVLKEFMETSIPVEVIE